jgi:hypothetical protein
MVACGPLAPTYSPRASGRLPASLWLKLSSEQSPFGPSEVDYYRRDYCGLAQVPIPHCYDACYDAVLEGYHLLLEDVSASHRNAHDVEPDPAYAEAFGRAVCRLHAFRWGAVRWREIGAVAPTAAAIDRYAVTSAAGFQRLLEATQGDLHPGQTKTLRRVFARYPAAIQSRAADLQGQIVVHGDPNLGNLLLPRRWSGLLYLIDRQPFERSLTVWLGASELRT